VVLIFIAIYRMGSRFKRRRLELMGHVIRMDKMRVVRKISECKPEGRKNLRAHTEMAGRYRE
jgi:hypothetical protein